MVVIIRRDGIQLQNRKNILEMKAFAGILSFCYNGLWLNEFNGFYKQTGV